MFHIPLSILNFTSSISLFFLLTHLFFVPPFLMFQPIPILPYFPCLFNFEFVKTSSLFLFVYSLVLSCTFAIKYMFFFQKKLAVTKTNAFWIAGKKRIICYSLIYIFTYSRRRSFQYNEKRLSFYLIDFYQAFKQQKQLNI